MKPPSLVHSVYLGVLAFFGLGLILGCPGGTILNTIQIALGSKDNSFGTSLLAFFLCGLVSAILVIYGSYRIQLERYRSHMGQCPRCGYDLRASPERCPECGRELKKRRSQM
jgi:hypothetical protein